MQTYSYRSKTDGRIDGFVSGETLAKARYSLWVRGGSTYYQSFKDFLIDIEVRFVCRGDCDLRKDYYV